MVVGVTSVSSGNCVELKWHADIMLIFFQNRDETKIIFIWFRHRPNASVSAILVGGIAAIQVVLGILFQ